MTLPSPPPPLFLLLPQLSRLCSELKAEAGPRPLLIMIDQEGGKVARLGPPFTALPAAREVTEAPDAYASAAAMGKVGGGEKRACQPVEIARGGQLCPRIHGTPALAAEVCPASLPPPF